jgi:hypothetical protein
VKGEAKEDSMADRLKNGLISILLVLAAGACAPESNAAPSQAMAAAVQAPRSVAAAKPAALKAPIVRPASISDLQIKSVLQPDERLEHGDYIWDGEGVPPGPLAIVVDLKAQVLYVYRGGVEIGRSAILYGADDKPTPTGTFNILEKKRHHVSNLYGAPMPYMMRLTWDGVAIHGSEVEWGSATHGCVGVPSEFAALLFAAAKKGDPVLVTNRWRTDIYGV